MNPFQNDAPKRESLPKSPAFLSLYTAPSCITIELDFPLRCHALEPAQPDTG